MLVVGSEPRTRSSCVSDWRRFTVALLSGSLCDGRQAACRCVPTNDTECTCDVDGLTCHFGDSNNGDTFRCRHDEMDCSEPVECERTAGEYADVCADVGSDQLQLSVVRADEPDNGPRCDAITCRQRPDHDDDDDIVLDAAVSDESELATNPSNKTRGALCMPPDSFFCTCVAKNNVRTLCKCKQDLGLKCYYGNNDFNCTHPTLWCFKIKHTPVPYHCVTHDEYAEVCMMQSERGEFLTIVMRECDHDGTCAYGCHPVMCTTPEPYYTQKEYLESGFQNGTTTSRTTVARVYLFVAMLSIDCHHILDVLALWAVEADSGMSLWAAVLSV